MRVDYDTIEATISEVEADINAHEIRFAEEQSLYLEVLQTQAFPLLDPSPRELLLFISTVIYFALSKKENIDSNFDLEEYLDAEEHNWGVKEKSTDWNNCLDRFFENYEEEDLLAFVEDMTADDEEHPLKDTDKEVIFISCKSYLDQLLVPSS
jgi:hypothetical protein